MSCFGQRGWRCLFTCAAPFRYGSRLTVPARLKYNIRYCAGVCPCGTLKGGAGLQTVALKPKRAEWRAMLIGLAILCGVMLAAPALCAPLSLLVPLLACPMVRRKEEPVAWIAAAVPMLSTMGHGYPVEFAVSLFMPGLLTLLVTRFVPHQKRPGPKGMVLYLFTIAYAVVTMLMGVNRTLGGPLYWSLAGQITEWVSGLENMPEILLRLASAGLVSVPDGYTAQTLTRPLMEAAYQQQMLMSLRLTLELLLRQLLPAVVVHVCVLLGVFIPLRLERVAGVMLVVETKTASDKRTRVVAPPSFRLLALPRDLRRLAMALGISALFLMLSANEVAQIVGQLCYAAFQAMFMLLGAAVLVFIQTKRDPDRRVAGGLLAAALYVIAPFVLLVIGMLDQTIHFRNPQARKPD